MPRQLMCLLLLSILASGLEAGSVKGLYEAEVGIIDQSDESREDGFRRAISSVLLKVTGSESRAQEVLEGLSKVSARYVQTFSLSENPAYESADLEMAGSVEEGLQDSAEQNAPVNEAQTTIEMQSFPLLLKVSFSKPLLDKKLNQMGVPIWGDLRPNVGIILVAEKGGVREILPRGSDDSMDQAIELISNNVGVPFSLISESAAEPLSSKLFEVWDLQFGALQPFLNDPGSDVQVIVKVSELSADRWRGQWALKAAANGSDSDVSYGQTAIVPVIGGGISVDSAEAFWNELALSVAEQLSERYAIDGNEQLGEPQEITLKVSGVSDYQSYASLGEYLNNLEVIETAQLKTFQSGILEFDIKLRGTEDQFVQYLALEQKLTASLEPSIFEVGQIPSRVWTAQWISE